VNEIEVILNQEHVGQRMDVLVATLADVSRAYAQKLIAQGYVWCNDAQVSNSLRASEDDQLLIQIPESESLELKPVAMDLDIVYEDSDVLVVNKPAGMVVHPAPSYDQPTLVEGLLAHCDDLSGINGVSRPGIVHRIDKDTSGLLVVAKNDHAHQSLSNQLVDKSMKRVYHALVHGQVFPDVFNIDAPIGRDPNNRQNMAVTDKNSKPAFTTVAVIERYGDASLVACSLKTGRTHQIRVHMQFIGFPLFCDPKYGIRKDKKTGQLLHAKELEFVHPTSGNVMHFVSDYPEYFAEMLKEVKERAV
jgi:23S rRNA pseudouridine1911/1915/1917 synthase